MSVATMVKKQLTTEIKAVSEKDRILEFTGSTESRDRYGDIVRVSGWQLENYLKNPIFLWCHDYKQPPIGKAVRVWIEDMKLKFAIQFAPPETYLFADTCYKLYKEGFLNATSVGFAPLEYSEFKDDDGFGTEYTKQELLELSGCPIPANPEALVSARNAGLITVKEFEALQPKKLSQAEILDEFDYVLSLIKEWNLNEANQNVARSIQTELTKRIPAGDTAEEIEAKALQAVINSINKKISGGNTNNG